MRSLRDLAESLSELDSRGYRACRAIMDIAARDGRDAFQEHRTGELAEFRIYEPAAFINRIRGFRTR